MPPTVTIASDVFHPLVTPLTTYTYSTRDTGGETVSAADTDRLPPGGLSLRHGFPEWHEASHDAVYNKERKVAQHDQREYEGASSLTSGVSVRQPPHAVEVLQYLHIVFSEEALLDSLPLEAAANTGAWHARKSYRSKVTRGRQSPAVGQSGSASDAMSDRSMSPRQQQPGGARRPGEWNWQGVWEERVKNCVQTSISDPKLYSDGDSSGVICFSKTEV